MMKHHRCRHHSHGILGFGGHVVSNCGHGGVGHVVPNGGPRDHRADIAADAIPCIRHPPIVAVAVAVVTAPSALPSSRIFDILLVVVAVFLVVLEFQEPSSFHDPTICRRHTCCWFDGSSLFLS